MKLNNIIKMIIGVLAIQGAFIEHANTFTNLQEHYDFEIKIKLVKHKKDFENLDALVIPGGESTVMSKFIIEWDLFDTMDNFIKNKPVFGTCAGAILLSRNSIFNCSPIEIIRNAYGTQKDSFIINQNINNVGNLNCIFIRAPKIVHKIYNDCEIIHELDNNNPVMIKYKNILLCTFHPELDTTLIHKYFIDKFILNNLFKN